MYGFDTRSPSTSRVRPRRVQGATMRSALKYWLLMPPGMRTEPPSRPDDSMRTGGQPLPANARRATPRAARASSSGWIGRFAIASSPSSSKTPSPSAMTGVRKRAVVPEFPTKTARLRRGAPAAALDLEALGRFVDDDAHPRRRAPRAMCSVSSLKSAPSRCSIPAGQRGEDERAVRVALGARGPHPPRMGRETGSIGNRAGKGVRVVTGD